MLNWIGQSIWLAKRLEEEKRLRLGDICMHQHNG